jgi:hypothetical protein
MGQAAPPPSGLAGLGLNVSPAKFELSMPPGTSYNIPVTVSNGTDADTHIQASLVDFAVATNGGGYIFERPGMRPYSLMRWASVSPREFDLAANTVRQVRLTISLPNDKDLNGEYAGIAFFQTRPVRRAHAVAFSIRIATKVYLTIPGTVQLNGAIAKMTASHSGGDERYRVVFKNTGNAHVYINGEVQVQKDGATVERIALPGNQLVERGGERSMDVSGKSLPPGRYEAIAMVDYGGKTMTGGEVAFTVK